MFVRLTYTLKYNFLCLEDEGLNSVKLVYVPSNLLVPGGITFVVPQCYMLSCPCVYGLEQYGHLIATAHLDFRFVVI